LLFVSFEEDEDEEDDDDEDEEEDEEGVYGRGIAGSII